MSNAEVVPFKLNPVIPITADWLEALIVRGWTIRMLLDEIEFRSPDGLSGSSYRVRTFTEPFPPSVVEWIMNNVPCTFSVLVKGTIGGK